MAAQQQRAAFPVCSAFYLQSTYFSFFSSQHVLLACLAVLMSCCPVSWRLSSSSRLSASSVSSYVSCLQSLCYPLLSILCSLPSPVYPLQSTLCLHSHVFCLLSTLSFLPSSILLSSISLLHSPLPICCWMDVWDAGINVYVCVLSSSTSSATALPLPTSPPTAHLCPPPPFCFHAKICNFIGLYRFAIAREAKKRKQRAKKLHSSSQQCVVGSSERRGAWGGGRGKRIAWKTFAKQKCKYLSYRKHALLLLQFVLESPRPPFTIRWYNSRILPEASSV